MADGTARTQAPEPPRLHGAPDELRRPDVAWPTLLLLAGCWLVWSASLAGGVTGALPPWLAVVLSTAAAYAAFTPAHDAVHSSVSRHRLVNGLVGRLATILLLGPFVAFRYMHLEHHKHVNVPEADPDHYSGRGPTLLLPLRWLTQDLHYYGLLARRWRGRPAVELVETVGTVLALLATLAALAVNGLLVEALLFGVLPARLACTALAFTFDYLPHRPHVVRAKDDRYRATHVLVGPLLTPLFLFQNYHLVHHLYPGVPFYRYRRVWQPRREELLGRGAKVVRLLGWAD